jgi:hypothetical protein
MGENVGGGTYSKDKIEHGGFAKMKYWYNGRLE